MTRRALVLGCGGVAGAAWTTAALQNVEEHLGWNATEADIIIGTSAGAVLGALLASGVSVERLAACQRRVEKLGDPDREAVNPVEPESPKRGEAGVSRPCNWDHNRSSGGALPPLPKLQLTNWRLALKGLRGQVPWLTALTGLAPCGGFDMQEFRRLIDSVVSPGAWSPHPNLWLVTVDTQNGERVAFGKPGSPPAALNDAVCASYGVPGWCPPVQIGEHWYMDGGVCSPTSADLTLDSDVEEVIILAPMASSQLDTPRNLLEKAERAFRRRMTRILDAEVAALKKAGKKVLRIEPGPADLQAIGFNMMDPARRLQVYETALLTTRL